MDPYVIHKRIKKPTTMDYIPPITFSSELLICKIKRKLETLKSDAQQ